MRAGSIARARGFSLVEMLLAVFILGIGVISIAALFPAGIALQRQATDDVVGPIVAKNALATIRAKLSQDDFGGYQDFGLPAQYTTNIAGTFKTRGGAVVPQVSGDWCWMRPGFLFDVNNNGTIDIFSAAYTRQQLSIQPFPAGALKATETPDGVQFSANSSLFGIPYNVKKYPLFTDPQAAGQLDPVSQRVLEPAVTFTQAERSWPQGAANYGASVPGATPQYYWDCMFRRNGGRVQVAVFVYRVTPPGGEPRAYTVARADVATIGAPPANSMDATQQTPPIPLVFYAPDPSLATGNTATTPWPQRGAIGSADASKFDEIPFTGPVTPFQVGKSWDDWMAPGQVWVDNHGSVHEVLRGRLVVGTAASAFPNQGPVKLQRQIPVLPRAPVNGVAPGLPTTQRGFNEFIGAIWFVPNSDKNGNVITPVYATVEEL